MPVDPIRSDRSRFHPDLDVPSSAGAARPSSARIDRAIARLDVPAPSIASVASRSGPPPDHGILYVGLNSESTRVEVNALARTGKVRALGNAPASEAVVGNTRYELREHAGIEAFVRALGVDPRLEGGIVAALAGAEEGSRGTLAQIALVFAEAERGTPIPSRLVLSGHSGGLDIFGQGGLLALTDLHRLARAMPRAASCIEDVHLAACSTSGQAGLDVERAAWRAAFPNLKTMWAYAGASPLAPSRHLEVWGRATRGRHETVDVPLDVAREHVAVWSRERGYRDPVGLGRLRAAQAFADARFERFLSGELTAGRAGDHADPQSALADYQTYRVLGQKPELPARERALLTDRADRLLRVRYYEEGVRLEFQRRHGAEVAAGFRALGLEPPDFGWLPRKEALAQIAAFEAKLAASSDAPPAAVGVAAVLRGLRDLDRFVVPESDCHHVAPGGDLR